MSVLSFSVQCAGEQSPTAKGILDETTLLQVDCPQWEENKLSTILSSNHTLLGADQARQEPHSFNEDATLEEIDFVSPGLMDGPPNIIHYAERPVPNGECSQSRLETDSPQKMDCNTSDETSNTKVSFPKELFCKEEVGHFKSVQVRSFPHLQCNGNGSCTVHKQGVEIAESICRSSDYELPVKDSHNNVINEDQKGDASTDATSTITKMQDSYGEDNEQIGTLHKLTDLTFQTDFEQSNLTVKENNIILISTCVNSVQTTEKDESQVQDHNQEGESGSLGAEYVEDHTVALWVKYSGEESGKAVFNVLGLTVRCKL